MCRLYSTYVQTNSKICLQYLQFGISRKSEKVLVTISNQISRSLKNSETADIEWLYIYGPTGPGIYPNNGEKDRKEDLTNRYRKSIESRQ